MRHGKQKQLTEQQFTIWGIKHMKDEIIAVLEILPCLEMKPTQNNALIMSAVYNSLNKVLEEMGGAGNAGTENRAASDSE